MKRIVTLLIALLVTVAPIYPLAQQSFRVLPEAQKGFSSQIRVAPAYVNATVLVAGVNQTITIPSRGNAVVFSSNCSAFYAIIGPTAAVPAANVTDGTGSELNPTAWYTAGATQIGLIAPAACIVTMAWYNLTL